ncbi:hypothetical protein BGX28_005808 [Mortierella sp. GBA30]|nr:hypothetical protein BGX28_005808 [Mortierella sp. GBA30]
MRSCISVDNCDSTDPILRFIAQELHSTLDQNDHTGTDAFSGGVKEYEFRLQSLLTRPRSCMTLFPLFVQQKRYQTITVQERLILVSVKPSEDEEDTIRPDQDYNTEKDPDPSSSSPVLVAGLEVLEYNLIPIDHSNNTKSISGTQHPGLRKERIVYIAKVDTSGCWPLPGLETRSLKSPAQALVRGYLKSMRSQDDGCFKNHMSTKTSLFVFARAQPQYLFADSAKNTGKRVLDDRGLVRWWKNMITSVYIEPLSSSSSSTPTLKRGWWLIPGIESERQALNIVRSTSTPTSTSLDAPFSLNYGYPDRNSSENACALIPRFPDDPKSRMMQSPSCQGGMVDIRTFWELAAIGEESGAGKITGFFRVIEECEQKDEQEEKEQVDVTPSISTATSEPLTGSTDAYTKAINFLLSQDFSTLDRGQKSTRKWHGRLKTWIQVAAKKEAGIKAEADSKNNTCQDESVDMKDQAPAVEMQEGNVPAVDHHHCLNGGTPSWIQQLTIRVRLLQANAQPAEQNSQATSSDSTAPIVIQTLNPDLIKRKESSTSPAAAYTPAVNVLGSNLIKRKSSPSIPSSTTTAAQPVVNVLGANLIRRKPTTTPACTYSASTSEAPPSASSTPAVNILGLDFIKKRKLDP